MIYIISGGNNSGKTAKIKSIYAEEKNGDGFVTEKIIRNSLLCGYEIRRLSTGESVMLSLKTALFPLDDDPLCTSGPFSFYGEGFDFAGSIVDDIIFNKISPVFIDEIGPLELKGKGLCDSFRKILKADMTIYFTVRNHCLEKVISYFSIENYIMIKT